MEPKSRLLDLLEPMAKRVAELDPGARPDERAAAALLVALRESFPPDGEAVRALGLEIRRGISEGWLCDRGEQQARFSRVAKASTATHGLSIDVVSLAGVGMRHTHPQGEVTIAFASSEADAGARFDGHAPGWVFMPPGTTHAPTVIGGRMDLLYFLPDGAVTWHPE
jgi:hypothetical protein